MKFEDFIPGILDEETMPEHVKEMLEKEGLYKKPQKGYPEKKIQDKYTGEKEPVEEKDQIYKQ